jgi:hypothetical protein
VDNFDWVEDLKQLLGDTADYVPGVSSLDELARGDWGGAATAPFASLGGLYSLGQATVKENLGGLVGSTKALGSLIGQDPEEARRLLRQSGRDTWEETVPTLPLPVQAGLELGTDPFNFLTGGMSGAAATAVRAGIPNAGRIGRATLPAVATGIEGFNLLNNTIPERLLDATAGRGIRAGKRAIESRFPTAFELSPRAKALRKTQDAIGALDEWLAARGDNTFRGMLPAVMPQEGKSLAPIDFYSVDPFSDEYLDRGVPSNLTKRAKESLYYLRGQSPAEMPGVNAPGISPPEQSGFAWWDRAKEITQDPNNPFSRIRNKPVGFVNIPSGKYQSPQDVNIDQDNLVHMATIGAAAIAAFDNQIANQMFAPLSRANQGMRAARDAIVKEYGPGINPFIPGSYEVMRQIYGDNLPDIRFLTAWGWSQGKTGTQRLARIQRQLDKDGDIEKAYARIFEQLSKGSPQIVEEAAAMGAGRLMADMPSGQVATDPVSGPYAPATKDPNTGRAVVPDAFESQFVRNRKSYDTYMRQLFGDLSDQELDTLRRMSTEILYDEYMNAAGAISGGARGATNILDKGQDPAKYIGSTGKSSEEYTKIGAIPGDDPADIGNRLSDVVRLGGETSGNQRPTTRSLNAAEYKELTGKDAPKGWSNKKVFEEVKKAGGTGFQDNPKGGILPNTRRLLDFYDASRNTMDGANAPEDWYQDAVDEVMEIVGPGRYEDAMMLIELMAVTSSGTGVEANAKNALRAFAEWKLGSDEAIRTRLGLSESEVDSLLSRTKRWTAVREMLDFPTSPNSRWGRLKREPGDELFVSAMATNQKKEMGRLFEAYVNRKAQAEAFDPTQGGPKTHQFAGSFIVKLWRDSVSYALRDNPIKDKVLKALDEAAQVYTSDRHNTRLWNQATSVTPLGYTTQRESALIAARELPDVTPQDFQSGLWYFSKSRQGFLPMQRDDDMATMLRNAWNEKKDVADNADFRARLREENPDLDEFDLHAIGDDLVRQEAVIAIIREQLGDDASIRRILGERDVLKGISELGNDALGIINRTGQGIVPRRSVSSAIPELTAIAEEQLRSIRSGASRGATWEWDGDSWVEATPNQGFAVALDSAGDSVATAKPKTGSRTIENFLAKYAELLDEPGLSERIKFGSWSEDPNAASFDLTLVVPDEARAVQLAKQFNQKAVYDFSTGRSIATGGTGVPTKGTPATVRQVVESLWGPAATQRKSLDEVRRRGVTIQEMDTVNPISIIQRRVVKPLMEAFVEQSEKYAPKADPRQTPGGGVMVDQTFGSDPIDFAAIGQEPLVSTQANKVLNESIQGESYKARLERYFDEAEEDVATFQESGVKYGPDLTLEERLARAGDDEAVKDIIRKYDKEGIDIAYADPRKITTHRIRKDIFKEEGIQSDDYSTWDLLRAAWGEQILFTPKYLLGNLQGAWFQNAFGGVFRVGTPGEFLAAYKLERGGRTSIEREDILRNLVSYQIGRKWGFEDLPSYLQRGGIRSLTSSRGRASGSAMGELTAKVTRNRTIGRAVGRPFQAQADMSQAIETVMRSSLWASTVDREMTAAMSVIEDSINAMAQRQGLDTFEFSILQNINPVPGGPNPKRLKQHLMDLGFTEGYAERAGRNFAEAKNIAERVAKAEVNKRQFSYDRTNIDEFVGKFIPFHYWYSRALPYYFEETLRHPIVLVSYMRLNQGIEDAQDDPGLSARQKGFLRVMGTPLGFSLLANPDALMGVVRIFGLDQSYEPDGQTEAGKVISWLKERGLGLYPWIDGTINMMGVYGDTFEPDMLGIRHKSLIGSVVNFIAAESGNAPPGSPYADLMGEIRYRISSVVSDFTPDWLAQPVLPKAGGSQSAATLDTVIESRIIARNPQLTNGQLLEIMTDPEHPEFLAAYQDAATAGLIQNLVNISAPLQIRLREDSRDVRSAQVSTIYEAAEKAGVSPTEFKPSMGDVDFAARYEGLTGKPWKPGDYENAKSAADLVRATPAAKPFIVEQQQYYNLGTPEQRRVFEAYTDLRDGKDPRTATMDEANRREIAEAWVDAKGYRGIVNDMYAMRDAFEQTHPDFGQFKAWQDQMYNLKANLGGSLQQYRLQAIEQNPNAREYFRRVLDDIKRDYPGQSDKWPELLDEKTATAEAWQTITGRTKDRQDPAPVPGAVPLDTTLPQMSQVGVPSESYQPDWMAGLSNVANSYGFSGY